MPNCSMSEWGEYLGDQHGQSRFYTYDTRRTVTHKQSLAKELKIGAKVVVTIHLKSNKSTGTVVQVHDPQSVISGTGTVVSADSDFGFIRFDHQHQSARAVFFSVNFEHPKNRCGIRLDSLVSVGSLVQFEAVPQTSNVESNVQYCAVRVNLMDKQARSAQDQQGIVVCIFRDRSLLIWSKDLGMVYGPKTNLEGDRDHDLEVGQWLEFDAREKKQSVEWTHWCVIKARRIDNKLEFKTRHRSRSHADLKVIDCIGVLTNIWDTQGLLWSPQLGRVVLLRRTTRGWSQQLKLGTLIIFDAKQIRAFEDKEDVRMFFRNVQRVLRGWQATTMRSGQGAVDNVSDSIRRCRAELDYVTGPSSGILYNEEMGRISFTAMDLHPHVTGGSKFADIFKEHKCFDVRLVPGLAHWPVKWCALYVGILEPQVQTPQQVADRAGEENTTGEQSDTQLDETQQTEQEQSSGIESDLTTSVLGRDTPEMKDAECQTEALPELALFRLICSTRGLLDVMRKNHKDQVQVMTQLVRHKFIPNQLGAKVEVEPSSSLEQRNVSSQTAPRPESQLANRLIDDGEMFALLMDIDQNLLMSIP